MIEDAAVVRKILEHLDLREIRKGDERGTAPKEDSRVEPDWVCEPVDNGWPAWSDDLPAAQPAMSLHRTGRPPAVRPDFRPRRAKPSCQHLNSSPTPVDTPVQARNPSATKHGCAMGARSPSPGLSLWPSLPDQRESDVIWANAVPEDQESEIKGNMAVAKIS